MTLRNLGWLSVLLCLTSAAWAREGPSLGQLADQLEHAELQPEESVQIANVALNCDLGRLTLVKGILTPTRVIAGQPREFVFVGDGRLLVRPPDEIEAEQLEIFGGETPLEEPFERAVLAITNDAAIEGLWNRRQRSAPAAAEQATAASTWAAWHASAERRQAGVDLALAADARLDPAYAGYFLLWMPGTPKGDLVYVSEPEAFEQITVGRFVPLDATAKEKRAIERALTRAQRRGRALGVTVDDLGDWDQWLSGARRRANGEVVHGHPSVEPQHYDLAVTVRDGTDLPLEGVAKITVRAATLGRTIARFRLHSDLELSAIEDEAGLAVDHARRGDAVLVALNAPLGEETRRVLTFRYQGKLLERAVRSWALGDPTGWYPHAGEVDRATYDVRLQWPKRLQLVASGSRVEGGETPDGATWERRKLDIPAIGFSFEIGKFRVVEDKVGAVRITMAYDPLARELSSDIEKEILETVKGSLAYFSEVFGPFPLAELTVVTVPRAYSQGLAGFVTLSSLHILDYGELGGLLGIEDRRTVIAHEIAHQWWGNTVGFANYRDVWISEALANYAANVYGRNKLDWKKRPRIGPTTGWQDRLLSATEDGRPVEALGPVVLGARLSSSKSDSAYEDIVYLKGALVFDMLSRGFGEEDFLRLLGVIVQAARGKELSTEDFFSLVGSITKNDVSGFARQFVYGTGLPEVSYRYEFSPAAAGKWLVKGKARQESPVRYRYDLASSAGGRLDVRRTAQAQLDSGQLETSTLFVPLQIKARDPKSSARRGREKPGDLLWLSTSLALRGPQGEFELEVENEPLRVFLDRDQEVFGRFFDETRELKRVQLEEAEALAGRGELAAAEAEFRRVFDQPVLLVPEGQVDTEWTGARKEANQRVLDARAHVGLARLCLDRGESECERETAAARKAAGYGFHFYVQDEIAVLESRAAVQRGETAKALKQLRRSVLKRESLDVTEAWVLLAIAARQENDQEALERALEEARKRGVDVSALESGAETRR